MMIGLSTILFIVIGIIIILTFVTFVRKSNKSTPPLMTSYVIFGLLLLNWLFFLMNGYTLLPETMGDMLFTPIWLVLCIAGFVTAVYEWKNNRDFAILLAGFTTISFLFTILSYGIGEM